MTTSISSLFKAGLLPTFDFLITQLKYLTPKTTSIGIYKMWTTKCSPSKLTKIYLHFITAVLSPLENSFVSQCDGPRKGGRLHFLFEVYKVK